MLWHVALNRKINMCTNSAAATKKKETYLHARVHTWFTNRRLGGGRLGGGGRKRYSISIHLRGMIRNIVFNFIWHFDYACSDLKDDLHSCSVRNDLAITQSVLKSTHTHIYIFATRNAISDDNIQNTYNISSSDVVLRCIWLKIVVSSCGAVSLSV